MYIHILNLQISEKDRKILDIESELFEMKRQLQDSKTTSESELKLVQLKIDQIGRENEELRNQKREIDAALRKSQAENVQAVHQVRFRQKLVTFIIFNICFFFENFIPSVYIISHQHTSFSMDMFI